LLVQGINERTNVVAFVIGGDDHDNLFMSCFLIGFAVGGEREPVLPAPEERIATSR